MQIRDSFFFILLILQIILNLQYIIKFTISIIILLSSNNARVKTYDMQRIFEISNIQTMLKIYYEDTDLYPEQLDFNTPLEYNERVYIDSISRSFDVYSGEGFCPKDFKLQYFQKDNGQSYQILFCVDHDTWGIKAGYYTLTPQTTIEKLKNKSQ